MIALTSCDLRRSRKAVDLVLKRARMVWELVKIWHLSSWAFAPKLAF